ncbi:beta-ketoacyl synthase chain length factor [Sneathiella sp. CAU 1612]|uniref:Beta-ketoacyl synthase chain length factor n=1 Tax=Sneathiella sedimenti TaxID=2816034 RepID=A0ABS3F5C5_9PROT|nr:beta-ketoacyl synthase chain length factor [Sneathiella sedimenti]MBO0333341.1 beta-ketoacyl synthase chain length factor [Sneathiella sedimenti]
METGISFSVRQWSAWAPSLDSPEAWRLWADGDTDIPKGEAVPDVRDLPAGQRRRLSRLGKIALRVAMDVEAEETPRVVFSSRNGNVTEMLSLLKSLAVEDPVSPTGFGMSVHNSLAGMLSIVSKNRESHTAIAAGGESLCLGLIEAITSLKEDPTSPVLLLHADETLPDFYAPFQETDMPVCALALLVGGAKPGEEAYSLGFSGIQTRVKKGDPLKSFIRFLLRGDADWNWSGAEGDWWCRRHA